ncbi:heterokaryon incompatibility protein-domain-containing protein [Annulohypoxylon moriforme]|nr:heterokaryon incompatibility protein-domain-containing protein [Annulohypoxylon moriforme]
MGNPFSSLRTNLIFGYLFQPLGRFTTQSPNEHPRQTSIYTPLNREPPQIRFITIEPSRTEDEPVRCQLDVVELEPDVHYAALSYVWGNPKITKDIIVNGVNLPVTTNLEAALRQFRKDGLHGDENVTRLWVDAICINQKDVQERNHQVKLMASIYQKATYVLSWLGPPDENRPDLAFRTIAKLTPVLVEAIENPTEVHSWDLKKLQRVIVEWMLTNLGPFTIDDEGPDAIYWRSLQRLSDHVYWTRMWIIQEMALARSASAHLYICGNERINRLTLQTLSSILQVLRRSNLSDSDLHESQECAVWDCVSNSIIFSKLPTDGVLWYVAVTAANPSERKLIDLIYHSAFNALATDPRDFVYALISLANNSIELDHKKSVKDVYIDAILSDGITNCVSTCLSHSGSGYGLKNGHKLPSWVPDFSNLKKEHLYDAVGRKAFLSTIDSKPSQVIGRNTLRIQGVTHGRVKLVKPLRLEYFSLGNNGYGDFGKFFQKLCVEYLHEMSGMASAKNTFMWCNSYAPLRELVDVLGCGDDLGYNQITIPAIPGMNFYRSAIACLYNLLNEDLLVDDDKITATTKLKVSSGMRLDVFLLAAFTGENTRDVLENAQAVRGKMVDLEIISRFASMIERATQRTLFKTDKGYLGIGPPNLRRGDLVCSLDQTSILRKDMFKWKHIGDCYVPRFSKMEAAKMIEEGELKVQTFDIC